MKNLLDERNSEIENWKRSEEKYRSQISQLEVELAHSKTEKEKFKCEALQTQENLNANISLLEDEVAQSLRKFEDLERKCGQGKIYPLLNIFIFAKKRIKNKF